MSYQTANAMREALESRLRNESNRSGQALPKLRKLAAFERFIARISYLELDHWVIKGGVALDLRLGARARMTKDLDLFVPDIEQANVDSVVDAMSRAQDVDLGDHFEYAVTVRSTKLTPDVEVVRFNVIVNVAGRRFEQFNIDVSLHDRLTGPPDQLENLGRLAFAGFGSTRVHALPLNHHLAEKIHAYTRSYDGQPSSRVKDLIDIVLISTLAPFESSQLQIAIEETFAYRATHELPGQFPEPPGNWTIPYRKLAVEVQVDPAIGVGVQLASAFLDPVLGDEVAHSMIWNMRKGRWE